MKAVGIPFFHPRGRPTWHPGMVGGGDGGDKDCRVFKLRGLMYPCTSPSQRQVQKSIGFRVKTLRHRTCLSYLESHVVALSSSVHVHEAVLAQPLLVAVVLHQLQAVASRHGPSRDQPDLRLSRPLVLPLFLVELDQDPPFLALALTVALALAWPSRYYLNVEVVIGVLLLLVYFVAIVLAPRGGHKFRGSKEQQA